MAQRNPLTSKSKLNLFEAIQTALLNDDCSTLREEPPTLSVSLSIIAMLWEVPSPAVLKAAIKIQEELS